MGNLDEEIEKKVDEIFKLERWRWHTSGKLVLCKAESSALLE